MKIVLTLVITAIAWAFALTEDLPPQCSTDTECEAMYGVDE